MCDDLKEGLPRERNFPPLLSRVGFYTCPMCQGRGVCSAIADDHLGAKNKNRTASHEDINNGDGENIRLPSLSASSPENLHRLHSLHQVQQLTSTTPVQFPAPSSKTALPATSLHHFRTPTVRHLSSASVQEIISAHECFLTPPTLHHTTPTTPYYLTPSLEHFQSTARRHHSTYVVDRNSEAPMGKQDEPEERLSPCRKRTHTILKASGVTLQDMWPIDIDTYLLDIQATYEPRPDQNHPSIRSATVTRSTRRQQPIEEPAPPPALPRPERIAARASRVPAHTRVPTCAARAPARLPRAPTMAARVAVPPPMTHAVPTAARASRLARPARPTRQRARQAAGTASSRTAAGAEPRSDLDDAMVVVKRSEDEDSGNFTSLRRGQLQEILRLTIKALHSPFWQEAIRGMQGVVHLSRWQPVSIEPVMSVVYRALVELLRGLRSHVTRTACQAAGQLFRTMQCTLRPEFDELVGALLARTADTNRFIRQDANEALDALVTYIPVQACVKALVLRGCRHKHPAARSATARLLTCCSVVAGAGNLLSTQNKDARQIFLSGAATLLSDPHHETRTFARGLFESLILYEGFDNLLRTNIEDSLYRKIEKTFALVKNKQQGEHRVAR